MSIVELRREILEAYAIEHIAERFQGPVGVINLKDALGTQGDVLIVRGDLAFVDELPDAQLATPKMWVYDRLMRSSRIQSSLQQHPHHKLFDGVGFSSLEALGFYSQRIGRSAVAVMAREHIPDPEVFNRWDVEVIHGESPMEMGYVAKQAEVIRSRDDLIPCHQALYGAAALAPVGNSIADNIPVRYNLHATYWCIAAGSNLYGIGGKIKQKFPDVRTVVIEPEGEATIDPALNLGNPKLVKEYALKMLRRYASLEWGRHFSGIFPLHSMIPNRYLLHLWAQTGSVIFDEVRSVNVPRIIATQRLLKDLGYDWTRTTALTLAVAIEDAERGHNVLVMCYGKHRENQYRDMIIPEEWSE